MKLSDVLTLDTIKVPLKSETKEDIIEELIDVLDEAGQVRDKDKLLQAILERENIRSTGIGEGLAVPHAKSNGVDKLVVSIGKPKEPIDFQSIDGKKVNFIVLMGSPADQAGPHIQALARMSRLMVKPEFREDINQSVTAREVYETIVAHEK